MSKDLKIAFPGMSGFSPRNIKYMRKFAQCWGDCEIVQRVVAQIPWRTNVALPPLDSDMANRIFKDPYLFDFLGTDMPRRLFFCPN